MIAVGIDVHKRKSTVAFEREDGDLRCFGGMENTLEGWRKLLRQLPEEWLRPPGIRALRLQARHWCWLGVMRTQVKNRIQSVLQMQGLRSPAADLFGKAGRNWLA